MLSRSHFLVRHFSCCCFSQGWLVTVSLVWWLRAYRYKSVSRYVRLYYLLKCVGEFGMSYMQLRESCCNQRWGQSLNIAFQNLEMHNKGNCQIQASKTWLATGRISWVQLKPVTGTRWHLNSKAFSFGRKCFTVMGKRKTLEKEKTDLEKENSQLKLSQVKLNRQAQSLSKQMQKARAEGNQPSCGHSHAKSPSRCTACHQRNLKRKRLDGCSESLLRLEAEGYTATNVKVRNDKTGESTCQADRW